MTDARVSSAWGIDSQGRVHCDNFGCGETHPLSHECLGEPGFESGRWMGWLYLDLNRPDLFQRPLRFCGVRCLQWWLDRCGDPPKFMRAAITPDHPLDRALRAPADEVARARAGIVRTEVGEEKR